MDSLVRLGACAAQEAWLRPPVTYGRRLAWPEEACCPGSQQPPAPRAASVIEARRGALSLRLPRGDTALPCALWEDVCKRAFTQAAQSPRRHPLLTAQRYLRLLPAPRPPVMDGAGAGGGGRKRICFSATTGPAAQPAAPSSRSAVTLARRSFLRDLKGGSAQDGWSWGDGDGWVVLGNNLGVHQTDPLSPRRNGHGGTGGDMGSAALRLPVNGNGLRRLAVCSRTQGS